MSRDGYPDWSGERLLRTSAAIQRGPEWYHYVPTLWFMWIQPQIDLCGIRTLQLNRTFVCWRHIINPALEHEESPRKRAFLSYLAKIYRHAISADDRGRQGTLTIDVTGRDREAETR
jgi:hypothetical protein